MKNIINTKSEQGFLNRISKEGKREFGTKRGKKEKHIYNLVPRYDTFNIPNK